MGKSDSVRYGLQHADAMDNLNSQTRGQYNTYISKFADYAKELGVKKMYQFEGREIETIQGWVDKMVSSGKSPATIHTYVAGVCKACEIPMDRISKPERTCTSITRSRHYAGENERGFKEQNNPKFERLVSLAGVTGIRRDEYHRLKGDALRKDESGHLCIFVEKGKGGKTQLQRILPENEATVKSIFKDIKPGEFVFSKREMANDIDLHKLRAQNAQNAYKYYTDRMKNEPGYREKLRGELIKRFDAMYFRDKPGKRPISAEEKAKCREKFIHSLRDGSYVTRGTVREVAECNGKGVAFDRLAVMAVSVYHLSHWRADVTVVNYLINSLI